MLKIDAQGLGKLSGFGDLKSVHVDLPGPVVARALAFRLLANMQRLHGLGREK